MHKLIVLTLGITVLLSSYCKPQSIVQVVPLPNTSYWNQAYGLAGDTTRLFVSAGVSTGYNSGYIYRLTLNGGITDSIPTGLGESSGLAQGGGSLWFVQRRGTATFRIMKVSYAGATLDSIIPPSGWYLGGAGWDGSGLWVSVYYPNQNAALYKYNVVTKTIVDTIRTYGSQPQGITWDGLYLYYVMDNNDGDLEKVYVVNPATRDTVKSWFLPEGPTSNMSPRGLAWDGRYLWLIAEPVGGSSGRSLYKYDVSGVGTPDIFLPVASVDMGNIRIDSVANRNFSIQNVGTAPLRIDSIRGSTATISFVTSPPPYEIPPGGEGGGGIVFRPNVYGADSTRFTIYSNDPDERTVAFVVRGFGIYGGGRLSAPAGHDFGLRRAGSSNLWKMTLQNLGGGRLAIDSLRWRSRAYGVDRVSTPIMLDSLQKITLRVWFFPGSTTMSYDTLEIYSSSSTGRITRVWLSGVGDQNPVPLGQPLWNLTVPDHPISNTGRLVKAVRTIGPADGSGPKDVIVSTENYWTMKVIGNSSVDTDSLWAFNTYISSYSAGSISNNGEMSAQKGLAIARDLNGDGYNDVVIGTGGGNEHVYAIDGQNGRMLWTFGTDAPDSFALGDIAAVDASTDFNGDGVPDVLASASATQSGGTGPRQKVYLFNGVNGNLIWQSPLSGFHHGLAVIPDINADGRPDVIASAGDPSYKAAALSGLNGGPVWDFPVTSASGGAKEVFILPISGQTPDVIVGAYWGPVYRVDGETGTQVWSYPTGSRGVMQLARLRDVTGDGIDEVLVALLLGGARCLNGASGQVVWTIPSGSGMGITALPDVNNDGYTDVAVAIQDQGAIIVRGQDGQELGRYPMGTNECREIAVVPDMDGNYSYEIIAGGKYGNVALISGGVNAGPNGLTPADPLPTQYTLDQNYPNPFNPTTTIEVGVPVQSDVTLEVFDLLGRVVRTLEFGHVPAGRHRIIWDGRDERGQAAASGVYLYRLSASGQSGSVFLTRPMVLMK